MYVFVDINIYIYTHILHCFVSKIFNVINSSYHFFPVGS